MFGVNLRTVATFICQQFFIRLSDTVAHTKSIKFNDKHSGMFGSFTFPTMFVDSFDGPAVDAKQNVTRWICQLLIHYTLVTSC